MGITCVVQSIVYLTGVVFTSYGGGARFHLGIGVLFVLLRRGVSASLALRE